MNRKQIWYLFTIILYILAIIATMIGTCILAKYYINYAGTILIAGILICFAHHLGVLYFCEKLIDEYDKTQT